MGTLLLHWLFAYVVLLVDLGVGVLVVVAWFG